MMSEAKMYTLEDDNETSSRLHKRDVADEEPQAGTFGDADALPAISASDAPEPIGAGRTAKAGEVPTKPGLTGVTRQITSSFQKLATPGQTVTGNRRVALAALTIACIGVFFTALDQTVVVTALPQIILDLHIPIIQLDHAAWIISAYLLGFVVAMPLMGRVSDIYGRRRIFLLCLAIFGVGSLGCGVAPWLGSNVDISFLNALHIDTSSPGLVWLIAARLFQAIGGGAVVPVAMAIAGDFYGKERRALALGMIGAVTEAGGALGPLYGALIVQHLGWQYIFYLNVPIVFCLMVAAWFLIPKGKRLHEGIDWLGALLLGIALTCLSLGLAQQGTDLGPVSPNSAAPQNNPIALGLAVAFLIAFVLVELKVRWPVVEVRLFKRFPFGATALVSLFVGAALIIAMADIPIFVDTVMQLSVLDSGLALLRLTTMIPIGAILGGWLCSRLSCRLTGVLGLLFTAAGFFLMSRWPIAVDWTQITVSTMTAGLGFGLVIAPIGTTAINAVKPTQAGMGSSVVTALRMVGMILGLAGLTSWALAYFKQLVSTYPSLPLTATADQFAQWSRGYAAHIIASAHTVYDAVFFVAMVLCLIAIIPALFLWGKQAPEAEPEPEPEVAFSPVFVDPAAVTLAGVDTSGLIDNESGLPPTVPVKGDAGLPPTVPVVNEAEKKKRSKRKRLLILISVGLILLLIGAGVFAAFAFQPDDTSDAGPTATATPSTGSLPGSAPATPTPIAGPRMIQLALDKGALTSIFVQQLNLQSGALTDLNVTPLPGDALSLTLNLHIDANGIHRVMPIELDGVIGVDKQQNLQLVVTHLKRDGQDAGPAAAESMQGPINQLLLTSVMPALRNQLKGVKLISAHTSSTIACSKGAEMLVLLIEAPPIQGIPGQLTPVPFCISGATTLNKLFNQ
jgi:EmrB/QacA subfamily drug resistance transporter